jgi:hypothetical protein
MYQTYLYLPWVVLSDQTDRNLYWLFLRPSVCAMWPLSPLLLLSLAAGSFVRLSSYPLVRKSGSAPNLQIS